MNGQQLRETLKNGGRVYGTAIEGYGQPRWAAFFASVGLDFVFMDNEHTPLNRETVAWAAQAYAANGIAPLLRIPQSDATLAAMGLDAGAHGIIAPYIETPEQVKSLVGAVKYRPLKGLALQDALDDDTFPNAKTKAYLDNYNPNAVLVIMIESRAGVQNLSELLSIRGVDAVLIGPHDLSVSYGVPEDYAHADFKAAIRQIVETCQAHQVGVGMHITFGSTQQAIEWVNYGFNFICIRSDTLFIARGIQTELGMLRQALGDTVSLERDVNRIGASGHTT